MTTTLDNEHDGHQRGGREANVVYASRDRRYVRRFERVAGHLDVDLSVAGPGDRLDPWHERTLAVDSHEVDEDAVYVPTAAAAEIADEIDELAGGRDLLAAEVDLIAGTHGAVTGEMVQRLERLVVDLRPAAQADARLRGADPDVLRAGVIAWQQRRAAELGVTRAGAGRRVAR